MDYLRQRNRSRFSYNLQQELLKHHANLQRALDGLSMHYVPTSGQRENIQGEQAHLNSMLLGLQDLIRIWRATPKPGREVPLKARRILTQDAHDTVVGEIKAREQQDGTFEGYAAGDLRGLENLLHYLDSKVCMYESLGRTCPEYRSLSEEIGFTSPII